MKKAIFFCLFICGMSAGLSAQKFIGDRQAINQILRNTEAFSLAYMRSDFVTLTSFYTEDAKIFPEKTDIIEGAKAIKKRWTLPEGVKTLLHKVTPREIKIIDDHAYDYGYYVGRTQQKDGSVSSWKGKYVIVWKKVDNDWKIYLDIWNKIE